MGYRKVNGLRSHRGKDGQLYWITDTFVGGRRPKGRRVYESWGAMPWEEAVALHRELCDTEWRRSRKFAPAEDEHVAFTFSQATERYLNALRAGGRDASTIKEYGVCLDRANSYLGGKSLRRINIEDLERMCALMKDGVDADGKPVKHALAFRTRKNVERMCSMLFKFATQRSWILRNPLSGFVFEKMPKNYRKKSLFRRLHPREDRKLLDACDTSWHRAAMAIGLYLGVGVSPVSALRLSDVNIFAGVICVPCEFNKGHSRDAREDLWVPMPRHLAEVLREQFEFATKFGSPWLFPTGVVPGRKAASGHLHPQQITEGMQKAVGKIGYADATFHSLRALCNNRLRASGIATALSGAAAGARAVLGHASEEAARPYLDAVVEYLRPVIEAYDEWLDAVSVIKNVTDLRKEEAAEKQLDM